MESHETYGKAIADVYDRWSNHRAAEQQDEVEFLHTLAGADSRILELGIGTGRVALPLAQRGCAVTGIDSSAEMLGKCREKPGSDLLDLKLRDMSAELPPGPYDLIFAVYSTFFMISTETGQLNALKEARKCLSKGGKLVIEASVPQPERYNSESKLRVVSWPSDGIQLVAETYEPETQVLTYRAVEISTGRVTVVPGTSRLLWPSQLDAMAHRAGFELRNRYSDWLRSEFDPTRANQTRHVSVYEPQEAE